MDYLLAFIVSAGLTLTLAVDQMVKAAASSHPSGFRRPLGPWLEFSHYRHVPARTGMASPVSLAVITCALVLYGGLHRNAVLLAAVSVAAGGALSNYLSRRGAAGVVNCFSFHKRLAFNPADVAIVTGASIATVTALLSLVPK